MSGSLSDSESAETALVFVDKVVKRAGSADEICELSRLDRKCPNILPRAMSMVDRITRRVTRGQVKNDQLEKELKDVVEQKDEQIKEMEARYKSAAAELEDYRKVDSKISTIVGL